jgi:hypothetical protein
MAISCILETPIIIFGLRGEPPPFTPASTVSYNSQPPADARYKRTTTRDSSQCTWQRRHRGAAQGRLSRSPNGTGSVMSSGRGSRFGSSNFSSTVSASRQASPL